MSDTTDTEVREIEAADLPARFARGWHCLGLAKQFSDGKPHAITAFGKKLVAFRSEGGELSVLDAYCRHMGGDLSQGTVKGDAIACPFHDWRWGTDGKCQQIPYARRVPLRARTTAWPTMVHAGMLFVWNDPEGNPPIAEQMIPEIRGGDDDQWTDWYWNSLEIDTNCREVIDNVVDMAHFFYVHYSFPNYFKNVFEAHVATQFMNGQGRGDITVPGKPKRSKSVAAYFGPSFMVDDLEYDYGDHVSEITLINCHYPVSEDKFVLHYGIKVKTSEHMAKDEADQVAEKAVIGVGVGFNQDVEIWKNKTRIDNPLLCEQDGPVYQLRRWYEQFYVDVGDIEPDMVNRFEFEVDTDRAVEAWNAEVAQNLADGTLVGPQMTQG